MRIQATLYLPNAFKDEGPHAILPERSPPNPDIPPRVEDPAQLRLQTTKRGELGLNIADGGEEKETMSLTAFQPTDHT